MKKRRLLPSPFFLNIKLVDAKVCQRLVAETSYLGVFYQL